MSYPPVYLPRSLDPAPAVMTLMLSLRFIGVVFGELHNVLLGLASRGIDWARLGFMGTLELLVTVVSRMFRCDVSCSAAVVATQSHGRASAAW